MTKSSFKVSGSELVEMVLKVINKDVRINANTEKAIREIFKDNEEPREVLPAVTPLVGIKGIKL